VTEAETTNAVPNPGTWAARYAGCSCAVIDNHYGAGYRGQPGVFVYSCDCPVHAPATAPSPKEQGT